QEFDLIVDDPQTEGMGQGGYSPEGFLRGWNAGNRFAHHAMQALKQRGEQVLGSQLTLPAAVNETHWNWNFNRKTFGEELWDREVDVFVPRIMFIRLEGRLQSVCVFPDLVPTAVPRVDHVIISRDQLPENFGGPRQIRPALATWEALLAAAPSFEFVED